MTHRAVRGAGVAAVVLAALALGRVITEAGADGVAEDPFVSRAGVGERVDLGYGTVEVTAVRGARGVTTPTSATQAGGELVLVDVEVRTEQELTTYAGVQLVDRLGRVLFSDSRLGCAADVRPLVGIDWRATYCFDVDPGTLEGLTLRFARGDDGVDGSGQRRDAVAMIDLGIGADVARDIADDDEVVRVAAAGPRGVS
ncbi:hypothetical protein SAMN04489844_3060 [Nocardioides exalbidus]|uniref:SipW-cognate class signal peptide n=1 Tax=Nocardioides exalbidus TaxID=402596 RepID=A0A1H4VP18_9ACTN|nr:hypothetical protein [Nocardioides exalbidus]SEC82298.1 hypothetical protein SAMN04489844_3060 [Nocardioides exalbidus]